MNAGPLIFTRAALAEVDRRAVEEFGIPILVLMENAGRAVAEAVLAIKPRPKNVLIAAGSGNNGGDGLVAARHLHNAGLKVTILLAGPRDRFKDAAGTQLAIIEKMSIPIEDGGRSDLRDWCVEGEPDDTIIDAIFGTGLSRKIEGPAAEIIEGINAARRHVIAVDIPSGIDADSGEVLGVAIRASETVSFCGSKTGFEKARAYIGKLRTADIGAPIELLLSLATRA